VRNSVPSGTANCNGFRIVEVGHGTEGIEATSTAFATPFTFSGWRGGIP
jgi:hypothetical protein